MNEAFEIPESENTPSVQNELAPPRTGKRNPRGVFGTALLLAAVIDPAHALAQSPPKGPQKGVAIVCGLPSDIMPRVNIRNIKELEDDDEAKEQARAKAELPTLEKKVVPIIRKRQNTKRPFRVSLWLPNMHHEVELTLNGETIVFKPVEEIWTTPAAKRNARNLQITPYVKWKILQEIVRWNATIEK